MDKKSNKKEEKSGDNLKLFSLFCKSLFLGTNLNLDYFSESYHTNKNDQNN